MNIPTFAIFVLIGLNGCAAARRQEPAPATTQSYAWPRGLEFLAPLPELHGISLEMTEAEFVRFIKDRDVRVHVGRREEEKDTSYWVQTRSGENVVVMFEDAEPQCRGIQRLMPGRPVPAHKWRPGLYKSREQGS
jgi:hypothetical protein